ncbi:MAG: tyrosine-type recombinase/integrase, partial [Bacteroidales bacterium]|nr:tyrosine-type recombinase/integrase [Bacteroidales bacterium]
MKPTVVLEPGEHHGQEVVFLIFPKDEQLIAEVKRLGVARWSTTQQRWYIHRERFVLSDVFNAFQKLAFVDYSALKNGRSVSPATATATAPAQPSINYNKPKLPQLSADKAARINDFRYWMQQKRYSKNTVKTYTDAIRTFLRYYAHRESSTLCNDDLVRFNTDYILANKYSPSYQNQVINAIKHFFAQQYQTKMDIQGIERPRRGSKLPKVIDKGDIQAMLAGISNLKHKTALALIYGLGLRRSELINMKIRDIDFNRKVLTIFNGKGQKDRVLPISDKLIRLIQQ